MNLSNAHTSMLCELLTIAGVKAQIDTCIEECAELIVALSHYKRSRTDWQPVAEELADVYLIINQLKFIERPLFDNNLSAKIKRCENLLKELKNDRIREIRQRTPGGM